MRAAVARRGHPPARRRRRRAHRHVLGLVHARPGFPWTLPSLAAEAGLSRSSFAERFLSVVGCTPAAYLRTVRVVRAAELLRTTTRPISQVAHAVGYASESAFTGAFRRWSGMTPGEYRGAVEVPGGSAAPAP
ncbi:MAG: helix-turn-helix transcriptional regulator [Phycisphaerales bacterium]